MAIKVLGAVAVAVFVYLAFARRGEIAGADAHRLVDEGARLLDVRTSEEFAAGHLPSAVNVPVQEIEKRMGELEPKDRAVVVYCRSGNRSARAARLLRSAGYAAVYDLGGMNRWE